MQNVNKRKVQVSLDADVVERVNHYLEIMGLTPTAAINMFYRKIEADGIFPFTPEVSHHAKVDAELLDTLQTLPVTTYQSVDEYLDWADKEYGEY